MDAVRRTRRRIQDYVAPQTEAEGAEERRTDVAGSTGVSVSVPTGSAGSGSGASSRERPPALKVAAYSGDLLPGKTRLGLSCS